MVTQLVLGIYFLTHNEPTYAKLLFVLCGVNTVCSLIKLILEKD